MSCDSVTGKVNIKVNVNKVHINKVNVNKVNVKVTVYKALTSTRSTTSITPSTLFIATRKETTEEVPRP